jgi:hypothetical protein
MGAVMGDECANVIRSGMEARGLSVLLKLRRKAHLLASAGGVASDDIAEAGGTAMLGEEGS